MVVNYKKLENPNNPMRNCSYLEYITFSWIFPILKYGYSSTLTEDDIYSCLPADSSEEHVAQLEHEWNKECKQAKELNRETSLRRVAVRCHMKSMLWIAYIGVSSSIAAICMPCFIERIISSLSDKSATLTWVHIIFFFVSMFSCLFIWNYASHESQRVGARMKSSLIGFTFKKVLKLSQSSLSRISAGHVITLISTDINDICACFENIFTLVVFPVEVLLSSVFLWIYVGWVSLIGNLINIILCVCVMQLGFLSGRLRNETAVCTDKRVRLIREMIKFVAEIKMNIWEQEFETLVNEKRREEMNSILSRTIIQAFQTVFQIIGSSVISLVTILTLALMGYQVTPAITFTIIALNERLATTLTWRVGGVFVKFQEGSRALERIKRFLLSHNTREEYLQSISSGKPVGIRQDSCKLSIENMSCSYTGNNIPALQNITCKIPKGLLIGIIGKVGSGKSSLLLSILRELPFTGEVTCPGRIIYTPQQAWIFPGSVRDNILCGRKMKSAFYRQVIESCGLEQDLASFGDGDFTILDEFGSQLSGGQRSRVSLARAVYSDADVYLLDAPLSSLDSNVASWVFKECLCKVLAGKTRLVVVNDSKFLPHCDKIISLEEGHLASFTSYEHLKEKAEFQMEEKEYKTRSETFKGSMMSMKDCVEGIQVIDEEDQHQGAVSLDDYINYVHSGVSWPTCFFLVTSFIMSEASVVYLTWWLARWSELSPTLQANPVKLLFYTGLVLLALILNLFKGIAFFYTTFRASKKIHQQMITALLHAPLHFYQLNPVGRILNRFSTDTSIVDTKLPQDMFNALTCVLNCYGILIFVCLVNYWFFFAALVFLAITFFILKFYIRSSNQLRRLEAVTRSPVYSHISTSLDGLTSIHVYKREEEYLKRLFRMQDRNTSVFMMCVTTERWLTLMIDIISIVFLVAVICISINVLEAGLIAALLALSLSFVRRIASTIFLSGRVADFMTSVERMLTYTRIQPEPGYHGNEPPPDWPASGNIKVDHLSLVYPGSETKSLNDVSFHVRDGEKVGIIGRTGAGKSSLIFSLLCFTEFEGEILVDGLPLDKIRLKESRKCFTVVPQSPFLFDGTIKQNIDLKNEFTDEQLWDVLADVNLQFSIRKKEKGLESPVKESGLNFSEGERQLICLARALLQNRKIVILDEATANVDLATDQIVQEIVRKQFMAKTVISVSHRDENILNMERVIVFDSGVVVKNTYKPSKLD